MVLFVKRVDVLNSLGNYKRHLEILPLSYISTEVEMNWCLGKKLLVDYLDY